MEIKTFSSCITQGDIWNFTDHRVRFPFHLHSYSICFSPFTSRKIIVADTVWNHFVRRWNRSGDNATQVQCQVYVINLWMKGVQAFDQHLSPSIAATESLWCQSCPFCTLGVRECVHCCLTSCFHTITADVVCGSSVSRVFTCGNQMLFLWEDALTGGALISTGSWSSASHAWSFQSTMLVPSQTLWLARPCFTEYLGNPWAVDILPGCWLKADTFFVSVNLPVAAIMVLQSYSN